MIPTLDDNGSISTGGLYLHSQSNDLRNSVHQIQTDLELYFQRLPSGRKKIRKINECIINNIRIDNTGLVCNQGYMRSSGIRYPLLPWIKPIT